MLNSIFQIESTETKGLYQINILQPELFFNTEMPFSEFCEQFLFTKSAISRTRKDILEHLRQFFDLDYIKSSGGRGKQAGIVIYENLTTYYETPAYQRTLARAENRQQRLMDYWEFAKEDIKKTPLNSLARIGRLAERDEVLSKKYPISASTIANELRETFKARTIKGNPTWVRKYQETYIPLTDEEVQDLDKCFKERNLLWQNILHTIGEADAGRIDKEEQDDRVVESVRRRYNLAIQEFRSRHGGSMPFLVYHYAISEYQYF